METTLTTTGPATAWLEATGEAISPELLKIPVQMAGKLVARFVPYAQQVNELATMAHGVTVTDEADTAGMAEARRIRLAMKAVRVEADKTRKEEKEYALVVGKAVDFLGRSIRERAETVEARLEEAEKFAERAEQARREALAAERADILHPICDDLTGWDLGAMAPAAFEQLRAAMQAAHDQAERERAEQEAARVAAAEAARAEQERIRRENEALRAETDRLAAELRARERAENERQAAELRAKQAAEAAAARAEAEAKRAEASAPDVERMRGLYRAIEAIQMPLVSGVYVTITAEVAARLGETLAYLAESMQEQIRRDAP
jgi:hypothetical protein